jgi:DNA-binding MarR family transcriptional regulator
VTRESGGSGESGRLGKLGGLAEDLLDSMAFIRRTGRRRAGRPQELSFLTQSQLDLVRLILRMPNVSVTRAAEELHLARNTVSTLVRQLADAGMLTRTAADADRRVARLELTEDSRRNVGAFRDRRVAVLVEALEQLSPADQRQLRGAVRILNQMSRELQQSGTTDG